MDPEITSKDITARLTNGSTTKLSHISTIQPLVLRKQSIQINILPKMRASPLISWGSYVMMDAP